MVNLTEFRESVFKACDLIYNDRRRQPNMCIDSLEYARKEIEQAVKEFTLEWLHREVNKQVVANRIAAASRFGLKEEDQDD